MSRVVYLEIPVSMVTDEQVDLLEQAVMSGLAEVAIKDRILFGGAPQREVKAESAPTPAKMEETILKPINIEPKETPKILVPTEAPKKRARGIFGRPPIERRGR